MTCCPKGDLCSPYQMARQAESKESSGMGKSEVGEELSMHWAQLWSDKFIKHCRLLTVSRQRRPVREEEQRPGQDRTAHALSERLSQRGNWREHFPTTSSEQQTDWQERPVSPSLLPPRHQQGAPIHANNPGKCSMRVANVNIGA